MITEKDQKEPTSDRQQTVYQVTYTESMVVGAVRIFIWRRAFCQQKRLWAAWVLVSFVFMSMLWRGDRSWFVGVCGVFFLLVPIFLGVLWRMHSANTVGRFRRMKIPKADFAFQNEGFSVASELASGFINWDLITEVWELPDYWMLFFAQSQFNILPITDIPEETRKWLRLKLTNALA